MPPAHSIPTHTRAVARCRAAIEAAGHDALDAMNPTLRSVIVSRAKGQTLREIATRQGITYQAVQYRERLALRELAGGDMGP